MSSKPAKLVRAFPWGSLESIPRAEVSLLRDVRAWAARHVRLEAFGRALSDILGAEVRVLMRGAGTGASRFATGGGVRVVFSRDDGSAAAALDVESELAVAVVSRAIRRPAPSVIERGAPLSDAVAGAFAAVVVAAVRRAHAGAPVPVLAHVLAAGSAGATAWEPAPVDVAAGLPPLRVALTIVVGDDAFSVRVTVARDATFATLPVDWTRRALSGLGPIALALPVVACASRASLGEIAGLNEGDAWLPGGWKLERSPDGSWLRGDVVLAAPLSAIGVRAALVGNDRLVLSGEEDAVCGADGTGGDMTESEGDDALLRAMGDVPVVVRVEIGDARMTAREWAAVGRGDVVTLGRKVGDLVLLRVGGVPVARGELVNIDGEVGVRVGERLATGRSADPTER